MCILAICLKDNNCLICLENGYLQFLFDSSIRNAMSMNDKFYILPLAMKKSTPISSLGHD